jgi:hypothetical protein
MANNADVRVRLSAEGQAEVIAAFQKISSAAKQTGKEAGVSMAELNKQFAGVGRSLLGGLGLVLVAEKFREFFKTTLAGAETMTRLSKQTGLSTDAIQALGRAARETGVSQDSVNSAITRFTAAVGRAEIGSKQSKTAIADLGISMKSLTSLSPDDRLLAVARGLAGIVDPSRRARDEMALFGRGGVEMDQALIKLGKEGFAPFIAHLQTLGVYLDTTTIAQMKSATESFREMGDQVKGLGTQFLIGLVPGLQAAADALTGATIDGSTNGFKKLGEVAGTVIRSIAAGFIIAGKTIGATIAIMQDKFDHLGASFKQFATETAKASGFGPGAPIVGLFKTLTTPTPGQNNQQNIYDRLGADVDKALNDAFKAAPAGGAGAAGGAGGGTPEAVSALMVQIARARYALITAQLDNELKLYKAHATLLETQDKAAYDQGAISLTEYYTRRAAIIGAGIDKQIELTRTRRAAESAVPVAADDEAGALNKRAALAKIDGELADLQIERANELAKNTEDERAAQKKLADDSIKAQITLLDLEGKRAEATRLKLQIDLEDLDLKLRKGGVSDPERAAAVGTAAAQGGAQIDFTEESQKAQVALQSLATAQKQIDDQVKNGQLFSIAAQQQIIALDKARLPLLQQQAAALLVIAKNTGNAEDIQKAEAYKEKIDEIATSTNTLGQKAAALNQGLENAVGSGLDKFLKDAASGTKTLGDAFRDFALTVLQGLEQMAEKLIEQEALQAIFGVSSGKGGGGSAGLVAGLVGAIAGGATGGRIVGPGTGTSDSVLIRASHGEFMVNAAAAGQPGVQPILEAINKGALKGISSGGGPAKYAAGGAVQGGGAAPPTIKLINVLDPTVLGDHLATSEGETAVMNIIARNPSKIRQAIS